MNCENKYASFWIEKGILYFHYKEGVEIQLPIAIQIVKDRLRLHRGRAYPVLCDMDGIIDIDLDSRRYFAEEGSILIKAVALVSFTPLSHLISKAYIAGNSPPIPTGIFQMKEEAIRFLSEYIH